MCSAAAWWHWDRRWWEILQLGTWGAEGIGLPEIISKSNRAGDWTLTSYSLPRGVMKGMSLGRRLVWESEALLLPSLHDLPLYLCVSCMWVSNKKSSQKTSDLAKVFWRPHSETHLCAGNGHTFCRKPARIHPAGLKWGKASFSSSTSFPHSSVLCIWPWLNFPCFKNSSRQTWEEGCCISACTK